jgi:hypothetical protein
VKQERNPALACTVWLGALRWVLGGDLELEKCRLRCLKLRLHISYLGIKLHYAARILRLRRLEFVCQYRTCKLKAFTRLLQIDALLLQGGNRHLARLELLLDWIIHKIFPTLARTYLTPNENAQRCAAEGSRL